MRGIWRPAWAMILALLCSVALADQIQVIHGPVIEMADSTSATISWTTNYPSKSRLWYSEDADDLTQIAEGAEQTTEHRVRLEGLQPNTTYFFQIASIQSDPSAQTESPAIMSFKTVAPGQGSIHNQKATIAQRGISNIEEYQNLKR